MTDSPAFAGQRAVRRGLLRTDSAAASSSTTARRSPPARLGLVAYRLATTSVGVAVMPYSAPSAAARRTRAATSLESNAASNVGASTPKRAKSSASDEDRQH